VAAAGRPTLTLPLVIFSDETSGNRSKKWNRLESYSMFLASLPREEISRFSNIHFISASNLVRSAERGKEISTDLKKGMSILIPITINVHNCMYIVFQKGNQTKWHVRICKNCGLT
jgi:hypothetical protein